MHGRFRNPSAGAVLAITLGGLCLVGGGTILGHSLLVWNASASAPIGLYALAGHEVGRGDLALVRTPQSVRTLAALRGYLPANVPMVKRIAAAAGDVVCARSSHIIIINKTVATRRTQDQERRPLPTWSGCHKLGQDEVFLFMAQVPDSFDGRYFGPTRRASIIGKLVPLWTE